MTGDPVFGLRFTRPDGRAVQASRVPLRREVRDRVGSLLPVAVPLRT